MKKHYKKSALFISTILFLIACDSNSVKESNSLTQNAPTLMVLPSDALLMRGGFMKEIDNQGKTAYVREYEKAIVDNSDIKFVISAIEEEFNKEGYELEDMEQALKQLNNRQTMDNATGIEKDIRTLLLNTLRPDYIIEVDYELKNDMKSRKINKTLTYSVKCLNTYTNNSVAAMTRADIGKESSSNSVGALVKEDFPDVIAELKSQLNNHYSNVLKNGIEITTRIVSREGSSINLDDKCGKNHLNDKIIDWMKENTVNQTFRMLTNTSKELYFTGVRIFGEDENGQKITAYDFARDLQGAMNAGCNVDSDNRTQGLGNAVIEIN